MTAEGAPPPVRVLPDDLADQIAAGEVVERPASVVKELCENALDAGASRVDVEIEGGGVSLCRVTDDGWGMNEADLVLSIERHATSKIAALGDLAAIRSFGFRGEALSSIASVSKFRITSRRRGQDGGTSITVEGGGPPTVEPCGGPTGTRVEVRDLFFNVPARRKFLRAFATESAHVTEVVEAMALARPGVTITLERDGRRVREHLRATSREDRARDVLTGWDLLSCRGARGPLTIEAFLSRPEKARSGPAGLRVFVNGRAVRDRALARSVAFGYGSVLAPGYYPVGVVFLDLPPDLVDVNVHPQKAEVRFADGRSVQDALYRVVQAEVGPALSGQAALGLGPARSAAPFGGDPSARAAGAPAAEAPPAAIWSGTGVLGDPTPYPVRDGPAADAVPPRATFIGQARLMFLLCETDDALLVVDQHAAAERVTFDRLKKAFTERSIAMQALLVPEVIDVEPTTVALVEQAQDTIAAMGMDVRPAGMSRISVHAVPQILARARPSDLASSLVAELARAGARGYSGAIDVVLATMACHGSIRAGDRVSAEQARELLAALASVDLGGYCPHGRPVVMRLPYRELEHRVGRR